MFVSKASLWEMAIKISIKKLEIAIPFEKLEFFLEENEFLILDFTFEHLNTLLKLPSHHSDPFDRLIISQAITNNLRIITHDENFDHYGVKILK
ncbi:MAG TPA: type II toxin-antitoxin system VapC family toxin [Candidatus Kapabacteria bacterium]|nr:type II toxin-antitoxin system VapC family toxin [Candidatus Kapabacteria bacterium]